MNEYDTQASAEVLKLAEHIVAFSGMNGHHFTETERFAAQLVIANEESNLWRRAHYREETRYRTALWLLLEARPELSRPNQLSEEGAPKK